MEGASWQQQQRLLQLLMFLSVLAAVLWFWVHPGSLLGSGSADRGIRVRVSSSSNARVQVHISSTGTGSGSGNTDAWDASSSNSSSNSSSSAGETVPMSSSPTPSHPTAADDSSSSDGDGSSGGFTDGPAAPAPAAAAAAAAADIFSGPAVLHGPVRKAGPLDARQWVPRFATQRHSRFYKYLEKHERRHPFGMPPDSSLPDPPPVIFPHCQVWVNRAYKFLYVRHAKAGSTSVLNWFGQCGRQLISGRDSCLESLNATLAQEQALWREYFVFTAVRNPYTRAVSQYKFLLRKMPARPECEEMVSWDRFCAFPPSLGLACRHRPECCVMKEGFAYIHLNSQAACMSTADGGLAVDYVIRAGNMDEEMAALFAEINRRRPPDRPELPVPAPGDAERFNVAATCEQGRRETETYQWGGQTHVTLAPKEQYCTTADYFDERRHPHCLAQLNSFLAADLRVLMRGPPDGTGSGSEGGSGSGSSTGSSSEGGSGSGSSTGSSSEGGSGSGSSTGSGSEGSSDSSSSSSSSTEIRRR